jgi:hemoglobin
MVKRVTAIMVLTLAAGMALGLASAWAQPWCAGAYDPKSGTNFGTCPPAPTTALYERLRVVDGIGIPRSGRDAISIVVDDFVANVLKDDRISARFKGLKPPEVFRLKANLSDQICDAAGGPCAYLGKDMKEAHKGMKITGAEWSATVEAFAKALDKWKIGGYEKGELLGLLGKMKDDIVGQ